MVPWDWVRPCRVVKTLGWCKSGAGCPVTLRSINGPRSRWSAEAPDCIYLRERHPETGELVPGAQRALPLIGRG